MVEKIETRSIKSGWIFFITNIENLEAILSILDNGT